jgi:Arylamine N-acetyltransferase
MLTKPEIQTYLRRIGVPDIQPPALSYLFELHRAHVRSIPWQTVDIVAGRPASIDLRESVQLLLNGRSGYCFHLNGAFGELLRSLGYSVNWHRAGVQPLGEEPRINSFHLGLTVDLPEEAQKQARWIVDVGLGDMPYEPLPIVPGEYRQGPLTYKVAESSVVPNGWRLEHDPLAFFAGADFDPQALDDLDEFKPKHAFYSQSPESPWMNQLIVRNRYAEGSNELRGCIWTKRDRQGLEKKELASKAQWFEVLADVFGERLVAYTSQDRDDLWNKVWRLHEEWKKAKASRT